MNTDLYRYIPAIQVTSSYLPPYPPFSYSLSCYFFFHLSFSSLSFSSFFTATSIIINNNNYYSYYYLALRYRLDDRGSRVRFPAEAGNFSLHQRVSNSLGPTQPPIQWVPGALSLGVKRPGREADHSPSSSAEVKDWVELYLHSPIHLHGVVLSYKKHRDNFPFTFTFTFTVIVIIKGSQDSSVV
jgi:hypothetical protein